jgi:hypothetical protein
MNYMTFHGEQDLSPFDLAQHEKSLRLQRTVKLSTQLVGVKVQQGP